MTPNSGACSKSCTRNPLRASASDTAPPPRPPPTTRIGSDLRVTAAPRITKQANPLGVKGESRAHDSPSRSLRGVTKKTQKCGTRQANGAKSGHHTDPFDFPLKLDA